MLKDFEWSVAKARLSRSTVRSSVALPGGTATEVPVSMSGSLVADVSPYVELADQRRKYGESMLHRPDEHPSVQREFEAEAI
jgi:hypothetical protein